MIEDAYVVPAKAVATPEIKEPIVFLEGIKAAPLIEMVDAPLPCQELIRRWTTSASVPAPQALRILRQALDLKILRVEKSS